MNRPNYPHLQRYIWNRRAAPIHGLAITKANQVVFHLTPAEAFAFADRLVDAAERQESTLTPELNNHKTTLEGVKQ